MGCRWQRSITRERIAAALAASIASSAVGLVEALIGKLGRPRELVVGGGLSRVTPLAEAIAGSLPGVKVRVSPDGDDTARGIALMASRNAGYSASIQQPLKGVEGKPLRLPPLNDLVNAAKAVPIKRC